MKNFKGKSSYIEAVTDQNNEHMCKLVFCTEVMKENFKKIGDNMLVDATYKTNKYQIPLVVFTGISCEGKNVLFGMALINDERYRSYKCLFVSLGSTPKIIVTDQDPLLSKSLMKWTLNTFYVNGICQET